MHSTDDLFDSGSPDIYQVQTTAAGPAGSLPLTEELLLNSPSGDLFGLTQNVGMGWNPSKAGRARPTANRLRSDITRGIGRSVCWCKPRQKSFAASRPFPSPGFARILAMAGHKVPPACSTAFRTETTPRLFSGAWPVRFHYARECLGSRL